MPDLRASTGLSGALQRIRRAYERDPQRYDRLIGGGLTARLTEAGRREVGEAAAASGGRILEIGIGTGLSLAHYRGTTRVTGVDLTGAMLGLARGRRAGLGFEVDLAVMDAQQLAFADSAFDAAVFSLCLCTVPDPEAAVREALRVVRPGGAMLFLEHVRSHLTPVALLQDLINPLTVRFEADHVNRRTEQTVRRAGVEVQSSRRWALGVFALIQGRRPL